MMQSTALGALSGSGPEPGAVPTPSLQSWYTTEALGKQPDPARSKTGHGVQSQKAQNRPFGLEWVNQDEEGGSARWEE